MKNPSHKIAAIIPAAGLSTRFGGSKPKQYCMLGNQTVLEQTIYSFLAIEKIQKIYIAVGSNDLQIHSQSFIENPRIQIVTGGITRSDSVLNALIEIDDADADLVVIHDAARPWMKVEQFNQLLDALTSMESIDGVYPVCSIGDSIRKKEGVNYVPADRESFVTVQTPQIFNMTPLKDSMSKLSKSSESLTDESQALERYGYKTYAVDGDHENIKITYSSDLIPPFLLNGRLGRGIDFHKVIPGNGITLGGVFIKCNLSIVAHSDGDVVLHSLADALLGAGGLYDIGYYFPDTDAQNENLDSIAILRSSLELLANKKLHPINIDLVIVCEQPKISPHVDKIKALLSSELKIDQDSIAIKATTTEGMGIIGAGNGIAVYAIASLGETE